MRTSGRKESSLFAAPAVATVCALLAIAGTRERQKRGGLMTRKATIYTRPDQVIPWMDRQACHSRVEPGVGFWCEKMNETTYFEENGGIWKQTKVTILAIKKGGNYVTDKRWPERHGFYGVEVGYDRFSVEEDRENMKIQEWKQLNVKRLAIRKLPPLKNFKMFRCRPSEWEKYEIGQKINVGEMLADMPRIDMHSRSISGTPNCSYQATR